MNLCVVYCTEGCCCLQIVLLTLVSDPWKYLNQYFLVIQQFFIFCEILTFFLVLYLCQNTKHPVLYGEVGIFFHFALEVIGVQ